MKRNSVGEKLPISLEIDFILLILKPLSPPPPPSLFVRHINTASQIKCVCPYGGRQQKKEAFKGEGEKMV